MWRGYVCVYYTCQARYAFFQLFFCIRRRPVCCVTFHKTGNFRFSASSLTILAPLRVRRFEGKWTIHIAKFNHFHKRKNCAITIEEFRIDRWKKIVAIVDVAKEMRVAHKYSESRRSNEFHTRALLKWRRWTSFSLTKKCTSKRLQDVLHASRVELSGKKINSSQGVVAKHSGGKGRNGKWNKKQKLTLATLQCTLKYNALKCAIIIS